MARARKRKGFTTKRKKKKSSKPAVDSSNLPLEDGPRECELRESEEPTTVENITRPEDGKESQENTTVNISSNTEKPKESNVGETNNDAGEKSSSDNERNKTSALPSKKSKVTKMKLRYNEEDLDMLCEWDDCEYRTDDISKFVSHVENHIPELTVKILPSNEVVYICRWIACDFECVDRNEISRHVNYHAFHTKIKCIGWNICQRSGVPACNYHELGRNVIPDIPSTYRCNWEDCSDEFQNAQKFYNHVECHVRGHVPDNSAKNSYQCAWGVCKSKCPIRPKLRDHVRVHTQEKMVGCPVCGGVFATRAKYYDHCKRQIPLEMHGYQCSHCFKFYPSERLLKGHMRLHVNHYKCAFCDMTCPGPASLSNHIRFRHLDEKPYKCEYCEFRGKTQSDLACHQRAHLPDGFYKCTEEGCDFSARTPFTLSWHYRKVHANQVHPMYCCHICDRRYGRGHNLTQHLLNSHSFQWPSGHSRFRYKLHEDGLYRLETVRYESLEVTQKMMSEREAKSRPKIIKRQNKWQYPYKGFVETEVEEEEVDDPDIDLGEGENGSRKKRRKVKPDSPLKLRAPTISDWMPEVSGIADDGGRLIEIAVEELNEKGQVVKLEFIHTKEVRVTAEEGTQI
ncbi:histone H4 transcription factor [Ischnura elegans]|uniref:histone H4 transcription factor n=1 Tax=Ischnura elegans TaxID=197161 RepID=UPI001ED87C3C|nr:histone H4 transcription factor [Ischnura elegans]